MKYQDDNKVNQPSDEEVAPEQNLNRSLKIVIGVLIALLIVGFSLATFYILKNKTTPPSGQATRQSDQNIPPTTATPTSASEENKITNKEVYIASSNGLDEYWFTNTDSGKGQEFIPAGYKLIGEHNYDIFPDYFILQKDDDLFAFNVKDRSLNSVFGKSPALKLKKNELVDVNPSITEKNNFYIVINEYDPNEEPSMDWPTTISTRSYVFDAVTNSLDSTKNIDFESCYEYDSKISRFFTWPCGFYLDDSFTSLPLSTKDLFGNNVGDVVSGQDYGIQDYQDYRTEGSDFDTTFLSYNNGLFIISENVNLSKITVIDPTLVEPTKDVYTVDDGVVSSAVKSELSDEGHLSSIAIDKANHTIVMGGHGFVLLLRFNDNKHIIESKVIPDDGAVGDYYIFFYNGKIFYQIHNGGHDTLRIINLISWQVEKSLPLQESMTGEITLVSF